MASTTGDGGDWGSNFSGTSMAAYQDTLVEPLFTPWAEHLLDRVGVQEGESLLDVACGPGTVARVAAGRVGRSGSVVGCDLSGEMLSIARALDEVDGVSIDYRQCSAEALEADDDAFDVAVCQQGLQFFADKIGALGELRRALRDGGRAGVSVWCGIETCEPFAALAVAIEEVLGAGAATGYRSGPWGFGEARQLHDVMTEAGFADVEVVQDGFDVVFAGPDRLIQTLGAAPVGATVRALDDAGRRRLREAVVGAVADLGGDGPIRGVMTADTATGTA